MDFKKDLVSTILPFWLKCIDYENGGIFTCADREGNIYGTDKSVWFQGRALWSFSKAYNLIDQNPEYLKACRAIYDFLPKCTDTDGRMFFTVTADGRIVNPGHSLEAAWFVMSEGLLSGNDEAIALAKKIIDITLPMGIDSKHGGIIAFTDVSGKPPVQLEWDMKLWWPQCEAMIALRMAYDIFGEDKYLDAYNSLKKLCEEYFVDAQCGEWYGYLHYDNTPSTTLKGNIFKGPFHIPRFYMIMSAMDDGDVMKYFNV